MPTRSVTFRRAHFAVFVKCLTDGRRIAPVHFFQDAHGTVEVAGGFVGIPKKCLRGTQLGSLRNTGEVLNSIIRHAGIGEYVAKSDIRVFRDRVQPTRRGDHLDRLVWTIQCTQVIGVIPVRPRRVRA